MIIAQITDLHVVERGQKMGGMIDTNGMAMAAVAHVKGLDPRPDILLATGDLADHGRPAEYAFLREVLDSAQMPYYLIPGNHDRRAPLLEAFAGHAHATASGFVQYAIDDFPVRLVALDTLIEEREDGLLCSERLAWLDETLQRAPDRPTLIFMHHPPFETGVWWMDSAGLSGAAALRRIVARHPQVGRIVCGHIHRPIHASWGTALVTVAPSTAHQVHLDLVPESVPHFIMEPPACLLHVFDGETFITHTSYINFPHKPAVVPPYAADWETVKTEMRVRKAALQ
jgi:3',5'-cyclic-AMP phosphodiesterase